MNILIALLVTLVMVCASEYIWRRKNIHVEIARKFVHVSVGTFVAFWPFFLSWNQIRLLSVAFVVVIAVSSYFNIFSAIHAVERPTWGEILFAVTVGVVTFVTHDPYIYAVAIMQMSLADGMAAIVGTLYGKTNSYIVFGQRKSRIGSLAFLSVSLVVLAWYALAVGSQINVAVIAGLALAATIIENIAVRGFDNLLVPILVAGVLGAMH